MQRDDKHCRDDHFYGTATVGDRGQIVIPADARKSLGIQPGDKLLILKHPPGKGLMLVGIDAMREFMNALMETLNRAEEPAAEADSAGSPAFSEEK